MKRLAKLGVMSFACVALSAAAIAQTPQKVLRFVPQYESTVLDPVTSILQVTHQAALLPYDTLMARDAANEVRPQMLESYRLDPSQRTYTMVLRPNLRFHDGSPVRAIDVVASLRRWALRDNAGVWLSHFGMQIAVVDEHTFTIETPSPTPMVLLALSAPSDPPFIMRERDAMNPAEKAVTEIVGSGPFRFVASEYVPGSQIVYVRNPDYVPRDEPASGFAGGKRVYVDRVEFRIMPDPATASAALQKGEIDLWEAPPLDLLPLLRKQPHLLTRSLTTGGLMIGMRPNHLFPPFNDPRARQALLAMVNQPDYMELASGGDSANTRTCFSFLGCGLPTSSEAGMESFRKQDFEMARRLLKEAGYDGRKIVLMQPTDLPLMRDVALLAVQVLRQGGLNLDVQPMDWATLVQRRAKQDPPAAGGWDLFITFTPEMQLRSPIANPFMDSPCGGKGWYGWPCDPKLNALRDAWATEIDPTKSTAIYHRIQEQAAQTVPFVPLGEYFTPLVSRDAVTDVLDTPLAVFWNIKKVD